MNETTTKQIFRIVIRASIDEVWKTITKEGEPLPHFFGSVMHTTGLRPGAPIRMRSPNGKYTGVVGEILVCEPPHRFSHTFRFTNYDDPPCKVTYELKEVPEGVEFTLISEDVPVGTKTEKQMQQGGSFIVKTLKGVVENGRPPLGSRMILLLIGAMQPLSPKRCLTTQWPMETEAPETSAGA